MEEHYPRFVRIWRFRVRPDKTSDFQAVYGPTGPWATLFHRVAGYLGTDLLHSAAEPNTYFTIDRWDSAEAWAAFLRAWGDDYIALDLRCESLTETEVELGEFRRV